MRAKILLSAALLLLILPAPIYAVGMGGMGGMGGMSMGQMVNKVEIETKTVGKVIFMHSVHGTRCNTCHPNLFQKKANSNQVGMKAMERGQSCGACHNGRKVFSVKSNCVTCHAADITFKEETTGDVVFSHEIHGEMYGCDDCHPDLFQAQQGANQATMDEMAEGVSCGACHDGSSAFSIEECDTCHAM